MPEFSVTCALMSVNVEYQTGMMNVASQGVVGFLKAFDDLNSTVPILKHKIVFQSSNPDVYLYTLELKDGRKFKQQINFATTPPRMTFDSQDLWADAELVPHRALREHCVEMIKSYGATKIVATWF